MTGTTLLTLIGSLGVPAIMASLIAYFGTRSTLKSNAPKVEAEADQVQATAAVQNLTAQSSVIATLVSENARLTERVTVLESKADAVSKSFEDLRAAHDLLRRQSDLPITVVSSTLAILELKGLVRQAGAMQYVRAREERAEYQVSS